MSFAMQFDMRCHSTTDDAAGEIENVAGVIHGEDRVLSTPVQNASTATIITATTTISDDNPTTLVNDGVCSFTSFPGNTESSPFISGSPFDCCYDTSNPERRSNSAFTLLTDAAAKSKRDENCSCNSLQLLDHANYCCNYSSSGQGTRGRNIDDDNRRGISGAVTQAYANGFAMRKRRSLHDGGRSEHTGSDLHSFIDLRYNGAVMATGDESLFKSYNTNDTLINPEEQAIDGQRQAYDDISLLTEQCDKADCKRKRSAQEFDVFRCPNSSRLQQIVSKEQSPNWSSLSQPTMNRINMQLFDNVNVNTADKTSCSNLNHFCSVNSLQSMDATSHRSESNVPSEKDDVGGCSRVETVHSRLWPCTSTKLRLAMTDPSLTKHSNSSHAYDDADLQLPRSVINKLVKDAAGRIRVSAEAREVFVSCCHEFVKAIGALANLNCEENKKKLIGPDHVIAALSDMGLDPFRLACLEIMNTLQEEAAQKRKRMSLCYDGDNSTTDKLLKEQQKLFEQARIEQFLHDPEIEDGDSSDESLKDSRRVEIRGANYRIPALKPTTHPFEYEEDDYD